MPSPKITPALFAIFDDDAPIRWQPWGVMAMADLQREVQQIDPSSLSAYRETFTPDLVGMIADPSETLADIGNWGGIIGAVVKASNVPDSELRKLHQELCERIAASPAPVSQRVGYYLIFCLRRSALPEERKFFEDLALDATQTIGLKAGREAVYFTVTSDETLRNAIDNFIALFPMKTKVGA